MIFYHRDFSSMIFYHKFLLSPSYIYIPNILSPLINIPPLHDREVKYLFLEIVVPKYASSPAMHPKTKTKLNA